MNFWPIHCFMTRCVRSLLPRAWAPRTAFACFLAIGWTSSAVAGDVTTYRIKSSDTDQRIRRSFDATNVVMFDRLTKSQYLVVFLPGTSGVPANAEDFLRVAVSRGYRTISLSYDNEPSVQQACFSNPTIACAARVRQKRSFGEDVTDRIDDRRWESIESRLLSLLKYLSASHRDQFWTRYVGAETPVWSRIAIAGHSQGGGMAEYIAKKRNVARVVILSGGWDSSSDSPLEPTSTKLAPWYVDPGVTPAARWYALYHRRENHSHLIAATYRSLGIVQSHIRALDLDPPDGLTAHSSVLRDPRYIHAWEFLLGRSP
jgi:hypothetical protein